MLAGQLVAACCSVTHTDGLRPTAACATAFWIILIWEAVSMVMGWPCPRSGCTTDGSCILTVLEADLCEWSTNSYARITDSS